MRVRVTLRDGERIHLELSDEDWASLREMVLDVQRKQVNNFMTFHDGTSFWAADVVTLRPADGLRARIIQWRSRL